MKHLATSISFLVLWNIVSAQKEANNWVFGNYAALSWNTGVPVPFSGSAMLQQEGVACISDTNGQLLFYTDGLSVWNRMHQVMPNGTGLLGDGSSAQSAIVVPNPANSNQYYLFTADDYYSNGVDGYRYNIVDMTLNGGLGDITAVKNVLLYAPSSEKLQAVENSTGNGYWIVTHEQTTNNFLSYELTASGLSAPVVSATGSAYTGAIYPSGCMSISPDATKLATVLLGSDSIELYDFSQITGVVSNTMKLGPVTQDVPNVYGISFSPNGSRLYVTEENDENIFQFNLLAGNQSAINASKVSVGITQSNAMQTIQIAPDGKMYVSRQGATYLAVINNPDALGAACSFVDDGVYLNGAVARYGLPAFVQSFFNHSCSPFSVSINSNKSIMCASDTAQICAPSGFSNYLWNTGESTACIKAQLAGNYYVTVTDNSGCTAESNHLAIAVHPLPPVAISVNGDTLSVYGAVTQQWYLNGNAINNATSNIYIATQGGSYTVAVTDSNGCIATSSAVIISGIDNVTEHDVVSVYPNPLTVGGWQLTVGNNFIGSEAEVFDADGRVVFKSAIRNPQSEITPALSRGVYLLRISSSKSSVVRKLIRL